MNNAATLQRCLAFLETQVSPRGIGKRSRPTPAPTITISRLTGSGGIPIAERLAAYLQKHRPATPAPWTVFHRTLVEKGLADHDLPTKLAKYMPEDRISYVQDCLEEILGLHPSSTSLVTQMTETILGLAELGNCILIGRGAHVILARCETALHVRLVSALPKRIERVMADKGLAATAAKAFIKKEDSGRARYLRTHFDADIDDPLAYHLVLNTDIFTADQAAELIGQAVLKRFPNGRAG